MTPTTPRERAVRIAETSTGFLYYVSVAGITGERTQLPPELVDNVGWLRTQTDLPICIGFGISKPEHVRLLAPVADGLIVGSAIVRRIATAAEKPRDKVLREVGDYVAELLAALQVAESYESTNSCEHPAHSARSSFLSGWPAASARRRSRSTSSPGGTARCGASLRRSETAAPCRSIR